ncbi:MAG TPA: sensor histidine kinase, partial [Thermoanaerobaculia bacterium]|nr:sensor histidine kinase [Thermoanaerobaculia bacterium]
MMGYMGFHEERTRREISLLYAEAVGTEERIRVARDLHDGVLQSLTGVGLRLAAVRSLLEKDPRAARESLESVQRLLTLEQRDLRFFIQELKPRPRSQAEVSLAFRVTELVHRIELEWGLRAELRADGLEEPMPESLAREVYNVVRESLVNAARHGEASAVRLVIRRDRDRLFITVADNGRGFPFQGRLTHAELAAGTVGPRNLFERVASLGGSLELESGAAGARLEIDLPCCEA